MTTSVLATGFGGPENLSVVESEAREPGPGEVRVSVRAAGVNPIDYKLYSGMLGNDPAQLPMKLGLEAAGVVSAVGEDVPFAVGDAVIAYPTEAAYASDLVTSAESLVAKPASLSFEEAAGLLLAGATAVDVLDTLGVAENDTVLLHGGAGGVGLFAIQLARLRGATVIATASERNHALLRELGATPVTYGPGLADRVRAAAPQGVDAAADLAGTDEAIDVSVELVPDRTRVVTIANFARSHSAGVELITGMGEEGQRKRAAARSQLVELAGSGRLRILVAGSYPLREAAEAHRAIMAGHTVGKIVLTP
jgi:NADPH:quinone reductase-like Zn-dependent oxidoreductase